MTRHIFLAISLIPAVLTPFVLYPPESPDAILEQLSAIFAFYPCMLLSVIGIIAGLCHVIAVPAHRGAGILMLLFGSVMPGTLLVKTAQFNAQFNLVHSWYNDPSGGYQFAYYLIRYVHDHPRSYRYLRDDSEEVEVAGFLDELQRRQPFYFGDSEGHRKRRCRVTSEGVFTPWGARIHFAIDRDGDGYITASGQRTCATAGDGFDTPEEAAAAGYKYSFAVGLFLDMPQAVFGDDTSSMITITDTHFQRLEPILLWSRHER